MQYSSIQEQIKYKGKKEKKITIHNYLKRLNYQNTK